MLQEVLGFFLRKPHGKNERQNFLPGGMFLPGEDIITGGFGKACCVEDFSGLQAFFIHHFLQFLTQRGVQHGGLDLCQVVLNASGTVEDSQEIPGCFIILRVSVCTHVLWYSSRRHTHYFSKE